MKNIKIIKETAEYVLIEEDYNGTKQVFRKWIATQLIEIRFSDEFAKANGYTNRADMIAREQGMRELLLLRCGGVPEWLAIIDGDICVSALTLN